METRSTEKVKTFYFDFLRVTRTSFHLPKGQIKIDLYKLKKITFIYTVGSATVTI